MNKAGNTRRIIIFCAFVTAAFLFIGLLVSFLIAFAINSLPMHIPETTLTIIDIAITLITLFAAGAFWGRSIASITNSDEKRRMTWAGLLSYAPSIFLAMIVLGRPEFLLTERGVGPDLPVHVVFTILFVPTTGIIVGTSGFGIGIAKKDHGLAIRLALGSGVAGGLCYFVVKTLLDNFGWQVRAPGAADRATMLIVMPAGSLAATLGSGTTIGYVLAPQRSKETASIMGDMYAYKA